MKFAFVNGQRQEAQPRLSGECPVCRSPMVAKCGEVKIWHWAHQSKRLCDAWWEPESEWHRAWKGQFPDDWQEVVHYDAATGEKHIADVKTDRGWVIELQRSYLKPEERRSRDAFYRKIIWVVDGTRRKTDGEWFARALNEGRPVGNSPVRRVSSDGCVLLREWVGSNAPVFFDFGEGPVLWWLFARSTDGPAYVAPYPRAEFIESHRGRATEKAREFDAFVNDAPRLVAVWEAHLRAQAFRPIPTRPRRRRRL